MHTDRSRWTRHAALVLGVAAVPVSVPGSAAAAVSGEVNLGWREVWIDGDRAKYRQHVNLDDGPRLLDLGFDWAADPDRQSDTLAPDRFELRLDDLGGDPYESISVRAERSGSYRARYRRNESDYFYEDVLVLPENASVEGSTGGDFRHFDFRRVRDTVSLAVDASDRLALQFDIDRYRKRGESTTVMDIEREEFELDAPLDETMESVSAGISYAWDTVSLTLTERYTRFDYGSSMFLPGLSTGSDPGAPTELEFFFLDQPYDLRSWEHRLDLRARPSPKLDVGVSVLIGDMDLDLEAAERSQGTDFAGNPFNRNFQGDGDIDQDRLLIELSAGYRVSERVGLFGSIRVAELDQNGSSAFGSGALSGSGAVSELEAVSDWKIDTSRFEAGVEFALRRGMLLAAGATVERRDVTSRQADASVEDLADVDTDSEGYFLRWSYRPSQRIDLYAALEQDSVDDPFTLASPTDSIRYRLRGRFRWDNGFTSSVGYLRAERDNDNSGWRSDTDQLDLRIGYQGERLTVSAGVSRVELSRSVDALVLGGFTPTLFAIDYGAEADFADLAVSWRVAPTLTVGASGRRYDNSGSFAVDRDDARLFLRGSLGAGYQWGLEYRRIDFAEGGIEEFDADIVELSAGIRW
ncbi:MAG: hypothetical protein RIC56_15430 [Pseudomonadales bacterium]